MLVTGCEKAVVGPGPTSLISTQSAEATADFYITRDGEFHWARQFSNSELGYTPCSLNFDGKQVTIVSGNEEDNTSTIHFSPALTKQATVRITNSQGATIFSASIAAGATKFSLGELVIAQTGVYNFDVYQTSSPNSYRNVPRYIVKAD